MAFSLFCLVNGVVRAQNEILTGDGPRTVRLFGPLRVINLDHDQDRKQEIETLALESRKTVRQNTSLDWDETAYIVWIDSREEFEQATGFETEFTFAAASSARNTIWINGSAWTRASPEERRQGMTHEMGHLLLGALAGDAQLPLWANEGMVQHMAGQWNLQRSQSLSTGRAIDAIPPLSELEYSFPEEPNQRELSYLISYKAIEEVIRTNSDDDGDIRVLMYRLNDKNNDRFVASLWDEKNRNNWNALTFQEVGSPWIHWFIGIFSHTTFWVIIMFLVIVAGIKVRMRRNARDREEMEEAWDRNLTKANIVEIYGPREGEAPPEELTPWEKHQIEKEQNPDPEPWRQD